MGCAHSQPNPSWTISTSGFAMATPMRGVENTKPMSPNANPPTLLPPQVMKTEAPTPIARRMRKNAQLGIVRRPSARRVSSRFPDAPRRMNGVCVDAHRVLDIACVAAGHRDRNGNVAGGGRAKHPLVSPCEARLGELEAAGPVAPVGVGSGGIEPGLPARAPPGPEGF